MVGMIPIYEAKENLMIVNKYGKKCESCGDYVDVGEGYAYNDGRWKTVCKSAACHRKLGLDGSSSPKKQNNSRYIDSNGFITMPYDAAALPILRSMPGARWNPDKKKWSVSTEVGDLHRVIELAEKINMEVADELRKKVEAGTVDSREALARAERCGIDGRPLYPFQKTGVEFLSLATKGALLADDQGIGKTVQALVALPSGERVVVVCPATVKYNWRKEAEIWRPDYSVSVVNGRSGFSLPEVGQIVICNYDILPQWLKPTKGTGRYNKKGDEILVADLSDEQRRVLGNTIVIYDECHRCANYKSQRSQKITQLSRNVKTVWGLTGTPLANRPFDLFGVLCSLNLNPFGSFYKFVDLFNGTQGRFGGYTFGMPTQEASERLRRVMLRRIKKDVLPELPEKTYQKIAIDKIDKATKKLLDVEMQDLLDELEFASMPDFNKISKVRAELAKAKIPAMLEIVESYEDAGEPLVVYSDHRAPILELGKRDGWEVIHGDVSDLERQTIVDRFQACELKGVGLTIKAGAEGVTLTRASNMLFVDRSWVPAKNLQCVDRICRIGQKAAGLIIKILTTEHPLDIRLEQILDHKTELIQRALDTSIAYQKPENESGSNNGVELVDETDEELARRLAAVNDAEREADRQYHRERVESVLSREYERVSHVPEPKLTEEKKKLLRSALEYMVGVCDGARRKDGMGFNKPDSAIAHWMSISGLQSDKEYRVLERILVRYRNTQLSDEFEGIWR